MNEMGKNSFNGVEEVSPQTSASPAAPGSNPISRSKESGVEWTRTLESPLGPLEATVDTDGFLRCLAFTPAQEPGDDRHRVKSSDEVEARESTESGSYEADIEGLSRGSLPTAAEGTLRDVRRQLTEFFASQRRSFDLPLLPNGTTFQKQVWQSLLTIPFGATESYGALAHRIDNPKAVRAVGRANGANPIAIVIPCHRVIGNDGSLTGYGGGMDRKRWLLEHEGVLLRF